MRRRIVVVTCGVAVRRSRGAGARTELESAPAAAAPMKSNPAEDAGRRHNHGDGDELARRRSRRTAGGRERLGYWKKVLGALKAGQYTSAKIPQGKNCHVDLRGKYADGKSADVSNVDICSDKTVNLTN